MIQKTESNNFDKILKNYQPRLVTRFIYAQTCQTTNKKHRAKRNEINKFNDNLTTIIRQRKKLLCEKYKKIERYKKTRC